MRKIYLIAIIFMAFNVSAQEFVDKAPGWYDHPPKSRKKVYGVGMGQEKDLSMAEREAKLLANVNIAEQVDSIRVIKTKKVRKNKKGETITETRQKEIVEASLSGVNTVKKAYMKKDGEYIVFVLLEMEK